MHFVQPIDFSADLCCVCFVTETVIQCLLPTYCKWTCFVVYLVKVQFSGRDYLKTLKQVL